MASALVVSRLASLGPSLTDEETFGDALEGCNRAVYSAAGSGPELTAMGTTVAGAVVGPESLLAFNVGDSPVFGVAGDKLRRLSVSDSPPPAPGQRTTSVVTQALGGSPEPVPVAPHLTSAPLAPGDRFLVCTDGLSDPLPDGTIARLLREHDDDRAAFALWEAAIGAGGPNNITLALVRIGAQVY